MNTVYEALRSLLRNKELEIKKLEKEIEALRVVLPIVAEAGDSVDPNSIPSFESSRTAGDATKPKALAGPDFENVIAQVKAATPQAAPNTNRAPIQEPAPVKPRTSWP